MWRNFWEEKKHLIEIASILTAVGTLFLTIPFPENKDAQVALLNIQLIWLIIITLCSTVILFQLLLLFNLFEEKVKKNFNFDGDLVLLMIVTICYFNYHIWKYMYLLYRDAMVDFFQISRMIITFIIMTILLSLWRKLMAFLKTENPTLRTVVSLFINVLWSSVMSLIILFTPGQEITFNSLVEVGLVVYICTLAIITFVELRSNLRETYF